MISKFGPNQCDQGEFDYIKPLHAGDLQKGIVRGTCVTVDPLDIDDSDCTLPADDSGEGLLSGEYVQRTDRGDVVLFTAMLGSGLLLGEITSFLSSDL